MQDKVKSRSPPKFVQGCVPYIHLHFLHATANNPEQSDIFLLVFHLSFEKINITMWTRHT